MTPHFNLLDTPWVPVRFANGETRELGLLDTFAQAGDITTLAESSPPDLIALYRLLLAITHRALYDLQADWKERDRADWYRHGFPPDAIPAYLSRWRERFWLFHPTQPFMQVAALEHCEDTDTRTKPWTQIALGHGSGNAPVVFDHALDNLAPAIPAARALRHLLGFLQCTPGGLVKVLRSADKAGPLANSAAVLPLGATLQQTLCLALHPFGRAAGDDLPAWEKAPPTIAMLVAAPTLASGPNDRYTRLSRAVQCIADAPGMVRHIRFAAGLALEESPQAPDPMVSYRAGQNGFVRLSFTEGRAFWRDLPTLLPDPSGKLAHPAAVLNRAEGLNLYLDEGESRETQVLAAGLASNQAKLLCWRAERLKLPARLLREGDDAVRELRTQVDRAEALYFQLRSIVVTMIAATMPDPGSKDTRAKARTHFASGPCAGAYFSAVEQTLPALLNSLANGDFDAADSAWCTALSFAMRAAWQATVSSLGPSAATLCAEARQRRYFDALLYQLGAAPTAPAAGPAASATTTTTEETTS